LAVGLKPLFRPGKTQRSSQKHLSTTVTCNSDDVSAPQDIVSVYKNQEQQQITMIATFPTLNLLDQDKSSLTTNQWTLINNLINSFDMNRSLPLARRFLAEHPNNALPKLRFKIPNYFDDLVANGYRIMHSFIEKKSQL